MKRCAICGWWFEPKDKRQKFCDAECRRESELASKRKYWHSRKKNKMSPAIKINPAKLPYRGEPTRAVRVETSEDRELRAMAEAKKRELDFKKRFQGRQKSASERSAIAWEKRADRWTPEKEAEILRMRSEGMGVEEIAKRIGRTPLAVDHKLRRLDGKE